MILGRGRGARLGSAEHERHKGRCGLFLLSLIGQDPLSLTFCTPSLAFHMLMPARPEEETCWSWVEEDKDSLSLSLPLFSTLYLLLFLPLPLSNNLTDFGMKGSECLAGWERWGWCSRRDLHHLWGSSAPQRSSVMCAWSVILSGPCSVCCRSVIVWAVPPYLGRLRSDLLLFRGEASRVVIQGLYFSPSLSALPTLCSYTSKVLSLAG